MIGRSFKSWVALAGGLIFGLVSCSRKEPVAPLARNEYVNAAACAQCHADISRKYSSTGMARAFHSPDAASFPDPKPYFHRASATWYRIEPGDGGWYQRWWQLGPTGNKESAGESKIDFVMGSGNHVRTYLHRTARGTLIELPLAWYAEKGGFLGSESRSRHQRPPD